MNVPFHSSPFLQNNFAPVHDEVFADDLEVIGALPEGLGGMFLRNGPNPQFSPKGRYHWFDGDGMIHGVLLRDGRASYRNRFVRTRGFEIERREGKAVWTGLTEMPQLQDPPHGMMFKNAGNTALVWHDRRLLALWEGGDPHQIELPSLETIGPYNYGGKLKSPFTAHPKVDPVTGEMMFFGYNPMGPDFLLYSVVSAAGDLLRTVPIQIPRGVMMHDFAITARHTIFMDLPLIFDPMRLMRGEAPFFFDRDAPSRFGIVPRHGDNGAVRWFEGPACYVFHVLNAYEEGSEVVLQACRMDETDVLAPPGHSTDDPGHSNRVAEARSDAARPTLHEWRFDLATGQMRERDLDDTPAEFPRIHDGHAGRRTRFGYAARFFEGGDGMPLFDAVVRYDLDRGSDETLVFGPDRFGGEAVFAPRAGGGGAEDGPGAAEDDGWLLSLVHDQGEGRSELLVIDPRDLREPRARVVLPRRVPWGFHAAWVDQGAFG
jgi:carotenoid cleavage dioxygenase-like enzyme